VAQTVVDGNFMHAPSVDTVASMNQNEILTDLTARQPIFASTIPALQVAHDLLVERFRAGGTLFICGNGGSMSDALHISGELLKTFIIQRQLPESVEFQLRQQPDGDLLVRNLQPGLRTVVLGLNVALASAVANDMPDRDVNLAQELFALARAEDIFLAISTSGNATNVALAAQTARALNLPVIALTGRTGGRLAQLANVAICVSADATGHVQELHIACYHALCAMLEQTFFGG
jgi:D-sedoheptulose 7-phosphate isomerase